VEQILFILLGKAVTYPVLFWACSIPCVSPAGGQRLKRAVTAGCLRFCFGIGTIPVFMSAEVFNEPVHFLARAFFWVGAALIVYRAAPFPSRGYRLYFLASISVFGMLLNLAWDRNFSDVASRLIRGC
jgi:hypothetical protein